MNIKTFIMLLSSVIICLGNSIFDMYDSYELVDSVTEINKAFTGPLLFKGGANMDLGVYIKECEPTNIGRIEANQIVLNGDSIEADEIFSFERVDFYKVTKDSITFHIMYMKQNNSPFEIILELRDGAFFDRSLYFFKDKKEYKLILYVYPESIKIKKSSHSQGI